MMAKNQKRKQNIERHKNSSPTQQPYNLNHKFIVQAMEILEKTQS